MAPTDVTVPVAVAVCGWAPRAAWPAWAWLLSTVVGVFCAAAPPPKNRAPPPPPRPPVPGELDGVTVAPWPTAMRPIWVSSTLTFTTKAPVLIIWICGVDDELDDEELLALDPVPALPPPPPPAPEELALPLLAEFVLPEPVAEPLRFVPPVPEPLSCWPTVRLTAATVPSIGAVRVAPFNDAWALASWAWAATRLAWSDWIWAADALLVWSLESFAVAESTLACALVTWLWRAAESRVANTVPLGTCWPAFTFTAVT